MSMRAGRSVSEKTALLRSSSRADGHARRHRSRGVLLMMSGTALALTLLFVTQEVGRLEGHHHAALTHSGFVVPSMENDGTSAADVNSSSFCGPAASESGYIKLPNKKDDHYFYWFAESQRKASTDPLILWLTGGPGCSSMMALLAENGPCQVQPDLTTKVNPYAWNREANVIWLDQPTGVGFSYGAIEDYDSSEVNVEENIYWFLQEFLKKHPELQNREFFIAGESYGGHYVPVAAHYIMAQNMLKKPGAMHINLAGISIGNGLTDPVVQYQHCVEMAFNDYNITLLNENQITQMRASQSVCVDRIRKCQKDTAECVDAMMYCGEHLEAPFFRAGRNPYDIRQECTEDDIMKCFHFDHIIEYLNTPHVLKHLNVDTTRSKPWRECDATVGMGFQNDEMLSYINDVGVLLDGGVRVLIYAGDADLMCNWVGNEAWVKAVDWSGKADYNAAPNRIFKTSQVVRAGRVQAFENLSFIRIFNAGHMVPMDQPAVAFEMINNFFHNQAL